MFNFLSKDNKELIHSQFIKFLIDYHKDSFYKDFLKMEPLMGEPEVEISFSHGNERGRFDLIVSEEETVKGKKCNIIKLVIENKFKSFPYDEQLEKYDNYLKAKQIYPKRILLTFDNEVTKSLVNNQEWQLKDYSKLLEFCKKLPKTNNEDESLFLSHYIEFLDEYVKKFKRIKDAGLHDNTDDKKDIGFWKSLAFHIVASKVLSEISNKYTVTVFSGRQFEPGFIIEKSNKNQREQFTLEGNKCWLEYQNGAFKLKFGEGNYDDLRKNNDLNEIVKTNGYRFYNKPRAEVESFSMIKKEIECKNLNEFAKNIVTEFITFKEKFNL